MRANYPTYDADYFLIDWQPRFIVIKLRIDFIFSGSTTC